MKVFHPDVYRTDRSVPSHWAATASVRPAPPLSGDATAEVAVIGGGYAGLSTALHLARDHGIEAVVLDAAPIGWGASGRNGGFVCIGAAKMSAGAMIRRWGEAETIRFHREQVEAVDLVRSLLASEAIDADAVGTGLYEVAESPKAAAHLSGGERFLRDRVGIRTRLLSREAFLEEGHGGTEQFGALYMDGPFGIHPLKYVAGLREAAERHGARIHGESPVVGWSRDGGRHRLATPGGTVTAKTVVVATNGYTPDDLHPALANRTLPALSNIVVTRPLTAAERAAERWSTDCPVTNTRDLLFYYRMLPDGRFLFGARGGTAGSPAEDERMRAWLTRRLGEVFPSWREVPIERFWNGLVCLTGRLTPSVGRLPDDPSVLHAFGWHGNGVNTATLAGQRIARAVAAGAGADPDVSAPCRGLPVHLLHPLVRRFGLRAAYLWYGLRDRL